MTPVGSPVAGSLTWIFAQATWRIDFRLKPDILYFLRGVKKELPAQILAAPLKGANEYLSVLVLVV
jgi:hypothetical protein